MKKGGLLKVLERHKMLTLALERKITQKESARELGLSLSHTKRLSRRLKEAGGNINCLFYHRTHPAPNRLPEEVRDKVIALKRENRGRSNPFIAELLYEESGVKIHPNTVRNILLEKWEYCRSYCRSPSRRFEMEAFGQMVQMDTSSGSWLEGYRRIYLVLIMDDFSRTILAARFFDSDSTYNNMLVLREAIENYGIFSIVYSDNDSKFKLIRHEGSRFFTHREETLVGEVITEIHRALVELGITLITHLPGNARAKGKIERLFRFIQERFISEHRARNLDELNSQLQKWIKWYNNCHINRDTRCIPVSRCTPTALRPLDGVNLDDIFCVKEERKVGKDNSFSLDGVCYTIPREHNMVALKAMLHIHPGKKMRVWHRDKLLCELPHIANDKRHGRGVMFFDPHPRVL
jgi:transposase InsO family protein